MNNDQRYNRSQRDRMQGRSSHRSEQFGGSGYDDGDDERSYYGQRGEGRSREHSQSENDRYGSSGGGWAGDRGRNERQGDESGRGSLYSEQGGGYSSGGYGPSRYTNNESRGFGSFTSSDFGGRDFSGPRQNYGPGRSPADPYGPYGGSNYGAGTYGAGSYGRSSGGSSGGYTGGGSYSSGGRSSGSDDRQNRGFFERAGDEVASWFGDEEAARRREEDHRGRGPANYTRSDERILEDACDRLTEDRGVDASSIQVTVQAGEVTLDGTVPSREQKRRAEDCVDDLSGVKHVQNNLRVQQRSEQSGAGTTSQSSRNQSLGESSYDRTEGSSGTLA